MTKVDAKAVRELVDAYRTGRLSLEDLRQFVDGGSAYAAAALAAVAAEAEAELERARAGDGKTADPGAVVETRGSPGRRDR